MSRILHLLNMSLRYGRSKGVWEYRLEEPPLGSLAAPCHLEESASHPPPSTRGSAPSEKLMFVKSMYDHIGYT